VFKRFMRSNTVQISLGWLVAAYMTSVKYTTRWEIERAELVDDIKDKMDAKAKGGAKASLDIVTALDNKGCIVVTPDGPRGPRQRMGDGPLRLAKLTGAPLMPCTFAIRTHSPTH